MKIVQKEAFFVTGIIVHAQWEELWEVMPKAWNTLFKRYPEIENRTDDVLMDISLKKEDGLYTQLIGAQTNKENQLPPKGMETVAIPAKTYIHYRHEGSLQEIADSFGKIYNWAKKEEVKAGDFKLDIGYTTSGEEEYHDLYVEVLSGK
ncbi:GyrI-like domain-containing protein [Gracilimonas mengyeensis]|uniref:Predicted transcriptional regulator YdeE, contains AraC-type DNA-binding domain n=1 Tax=Gracilimonas mengyeensis TaxID=1302730 RepID=A0A521C6J4_9BACT|nr:GyrI-like domain-containing protein [Gracilimonas mengyeensis]SMO55072.1 Predicted transcriptional regulator YdeE, contains AraC-type DNA-binding domain [Gracilimonas mengyeensis]